jgi:ABC-type branched-subunit amino acid transport system ATPase component
MSETPYLVVDNVTKSFGQFQAVREASFTVKRGEFVCFLGPSGCGKTTLLRMIAGLEKMSSGRVVQDGRDISWLPPSQRDFGIVFQSYALFPNLTVFDNVAYGLRGRGKSNAEIAGRVDELLTLVGLPDLIASTADDYIRIATALAAWRTEKRCAALRLTRKAAAAVSSTTPAATTSFGRTGSSATESAACSRMMSPVPSRAAAGAK